MPDSSVTKLSTVYPLFENVTCFSFSAKVSICFKNHNLFYLNRCFLTTEPAPSPFKQEGSFRGILLKFMEIILNASYAGSWCQEPRNIWWFVIWPTNIQRSISCTLWRFEKFSQMAFLHLLGTTHGHSLDINDAASPLLRKIVFQKIISNFTRHFDASSTEVSGEFFSQIDIDYSFRYNKTAGFARFVLTLSLLHSRNLRQ